MNVAIRPACPADRDGLAMIQRAAIAAIDDGPYSVAERQAWRDNAVEDLCPLIRAGRYRVAEQAGVLLGGAGWEEDAAIGGATIRAVFVDPASHGKGIGARLLGTIEQELAARGITRLAVPAALNAIGFYRKLGYRPAGRREAELGGMRLPYERMLKEAA
ncbi:MAG: GNAT family N-acetyltransferase [Acetobacteraceae bacterium]|jgi:GNAT superfamily N-acetyltransferase|nr:GNAT family N-acetyltransferase [Acetobacteraceae bacterium]